MLINFIGSPSSGKTTTAAMLYASLKETGIVCEFSTEQARLYIARKRVRLSLPPSKFPTLTDADQILIMQKQLEIDETFVESCGPNVLVISDSSPLNSLLYMDSETLSKKSVKDCIARSIAITTATFLAEPIAMTWSKDPNRVHTQKQSQAVQQRIAPILATLPPFRVVPLCGSPTERLLAVQNYVFRLL
jgi:predicted ATPase